MKKIILALLLISFLALPAIGLAMTQPECMAAGRYWDGTRCVDAPPIVDPVTAIVRISNLVFGLFMAIAFLFFIWGAFTMLTSAGDNSKFTTGRTHILYAVIAVIVGFGARAIIGWVTRFLGV